MNLVETKADNLEQIRVLWEKDYREGFSRRRSISKVCTESFVVLYDKDRELYKSIKLNHCPFDKGALAKNTIVEGKILNYVINTYPYFDMHFLAFPYEHRGQPKEEDLEEIIELLQVTDHVVLMNMVGAGASIPDHIHYQCIKADLPIKNAHGEIIYEDNIITLEKIAFPCYAIKHTWKNDAGRSLVESAAISQKGPYNLLIYPECLYEIPRTAVFSPLAPEYKIGGAEVGGYFVVTSQELYEKLDIIMLEQILCDTTLVDTAEQKQYEVELLNFFN